MNFSETFCWIIQSFFTGYPALHVLLYGSRGSGKSSLVKALLNEYGNQNLRLIEVAKSDLKDLPTIVEQLCRVHHLCRWPLVWRRWFFFLKSCWKLNSNLQTWWCMQLLIDDTWFGSFLEIALVPAIMKKSTPGIQYRRNFHLAIGLTLTFEPPNQLTYLTIVRHLAAQAKITQPGRFGISGLAVGNSSQWSFRTDSTTVYRLPPSRIDCF